MQNYLRGILLSQVLWANQATLCHFYAERFLVPLKLGADALEIGSGHGLLMYFAARLHSVPAGSLLQQCYLPQSSGLQPCDACARRVV